MKQISSGKTDLPLIRLGLVFPLIDELERRNIHYQQALATFNLVKQDVLGGEMFIPAPVMYGIVEQLAEVSGDPHFGVRVGAKLDPFAWPPLAEAAELSGTVGEFLLRFLIDATDHESSVTHVLETKGGHTTFHEKRKVDGNIFPRHNDGFTIAYLLSLLSKALGEHWDGHKVLARLCDPGVLPDDYLGVRSATTDTFGPSITFPCNWLILPLAMKRTRVYNRVTLTGSPLPTQWIEAFRQILQRHIHEFDLTTRRVADICGYSKRTLARKLQAHGTSIQQEIANLRKMRARRELINSKHPISEIALMLGYTDTTVFSRAFKRWTGLSPSQYRKKSASENLPILNN